ncbi:RB1-inducible coiled-coil protein 1 isoform X2 [Phymastichus coffea]|uniref:RB1-inducible coiled-coil protein 1 isoform X2 n=1 Tax=Phymastichus coffea TaxID=108790 RepID=UPI00273C6645|nr:RB1-inducible coiled-coil protein 1 isoform X2 [Phymastichus coffea]
MNMLYVFQVETGATFTFDNKFALASVAELKQTIERECAVSADQQVLLMSGGESLEPDARVCCYSTGSDTNPIFLFSKLLIAQDEPPTPIIDYGSDVDLQSQVEQSLTMPATYQTLVSRAQLAKYCCSLARDQARICERLVHDQHLQQQGWAAVVANLEDITKTFQSRAETVQQNFAGYLSERQHYLDLLQTFFTDLKMLENIPILPALRAHAEGFYDPKDQQEAAAEKDDNETTNPTNPSTKEVELEITATDPLSLLRWISAKDNQSSLEQVAEQCARGLEQFDECTMEAIKTEIKHVIEAASRRDMKDVEQMGIRLFQLEKMMVNTKKIVSEQTELSHGFCQNRDRVSKLNDESVLPDLCRSHRKQLEVMLKNHNELRDIRSRCTLAKQQLAPNLHERLKWIMQVENCMMDIDNRLVLYNESLRRLRRQLEILRQIHMAPQMYMEAIAEVVRRRTFSQAFLMWASDLASQLLSVHSEEIERRREFRNKFEGHFLNTLFPGLEDVPPPFATQAPAVFDNGLPKLNPEDMELLKQKLPDLANRVSTPDLSSITQFFFSKSITESSNDGNKEKESASMRVDDVPKEQEAARPPLISDRGDFESETDTEEFEKIGQAATDSKLTSYESIKQQTPIRQKQMEVGAASISTSSTSTNVSPLNRSTSSSSELLQFPSLSTSEKKDQQPLSPLTECVEHNPSSPKLASNFPTNTTTSSCDGQQKKLRRQSGSDGSSPSVGNGIGPNDFLGTEFYMDESLPSSLSEHPTDSQHQAIVSLLQENLNNSREEVERLRDTIRNLKSVARDSIRMLRRELDIMKEHSMLDRQIITKHVEDICKVLSVHRCALKEREQEITVDHELELSDLKKMLQTRDEQICNLERALADKETDSSEKDKLIATMRQKIEGEQQEMKKLQIVYRQIEERLEQTLADKEAAIKEADDARVAETNTLRNSLEKSQEKVEKLEEKLILAEIRFQKTMKEENDKLQVVEYKAQCEAIRSRFKLIHASTIERSPSDSSLEKIERADLLELSNHESMISQAEEPTTDECKLATEDECLKMSQTNSELGESMKSEKSDDVKVSESKKVRLETDSDLLSLPMKLELLEAENQRLNSELRASHESKEDMESKLEVLTNEKQRLEIELLTERVSKKVVSTDSMSSSSIASSPGVNHDKEMNLSVAVVGVSPSRVDASTSTERSRREPSSSHSLRDKLTKSTTTLAQHGKITYTSCNTGDIVLVTWDQEHRNYTLLQDSQTFYFLNSDCIADLGLKLKPDGQPLKPHVIAEVVEKEYCSARKSENRYRVPQGTKFFRVRVKPLQRLITTGKH